MEILYKKKINSLQEINKKRDNKKLTNKYINKVIYNNKRIRNLTKFFIKKENNIKTFKMMF